MKNRPNFLSQRTVNWSKREPSKILKTLAYGQIWFCTAMFATYQVFLKTELMSDGHLCTWGWGTYTHLPKYLFLPGWDNTDYCSFTYADGEGVPACLNGLQQSLARLLFPAMSVKAIFLSVENSGSKHPQTNYFLLSENMWSRERLCHVYLKITVRKQHPLTEYSTFSCAISNC